MHLIDYNWPSPMIACVLCSQNVFEPLSFPLNTGISYHQQFQTCYKPQVHGIQLCFECFFQYLFTDGALWFGRQTNKRILSPGIQLTHWKTLYFQITYHFFHWKKGTPFAADDQGIYNRLTWWEQIDNGQQLTRNRKFLTVVPVVL